MISRDEFLMFTENKLGTKKWNEIKMFIIKQENKLKDLQDGQKCINCKYGKLTEGFDTIKKEWVKNHSITCRSQNSVSTFIERLDYGCIDFERKVND